MAIFTPHRIPPEAPADVLAAARDRRRRADALEAELLALAVDWATMHPVESLDAEAATYAERGFETDVAIAGVGAPRVAEFCVAEFAAAVGLSSEAGKRLLGEAVELRYRLPRTYDRVCSGELVAWKARRVARETSRLSQEAAGYVDQHVAPTAHRLKPAQLDRTVQEAIGRFMPEEVERLAEQALERRHVTFHDQQVAFAGTMEVTAELDLADALDLQSAVQTGAAQRAALGSEEPLDVRRSQALGDLARHQPTLDLEPGFSPVEPSSLVEPVETTTPRVPARQVILHVHLSHDALAGHDPTARLEHADTLVTTEQVRAWCGSPETAKVVVKPVLDLDTCHVVDSDVVPDRLVELITVRDRHCVFPWCTRPARATGHRHGCDADHIHPGSRGGPTCSCNLAPLCRRHHRLKTHSPWTYLALDPGTYLWSSPHGYQFHVDQTGTRDITRDQPPDHQSRSPADT